MMKKFVFAVAFVALLAGCDKSNPDNTKEELDITGCWELTTVTTKASVGGQSVSVYISFESGGSFTLYQSLGSDRYTQFSGTWTLNQTEAQLSGTYSGGASWGPYTAAMSGSNLSLTSSGGKEVDTYRKIDAIPSTVTENTY